MAARDITEAERKALKAKYKNERNANVNVRSAMIAVVAAFLHTLLVAFFGCWNVVVHIFLYRLNVEAR